MAAEPPPPGRASGTSSGNRRGGRGHDRSHQVGRGCGGCWRLWLPGGARPAREAAAGAGLGGALGKAAAPGLAQTPAPPSPGTGGPPGPPRRRRRRRRRRSSPKPCARRREHIHRGVPAASGRRRLPAPGAPAPSCRLTRLPGALGPARAHRPARAQTRLAGPPARPPRAPPPPPDAHPRPRLPGAERLLSALPPPRHTHTFSSFSELEHRSGREAAAAEGGGGGRGGDGRGRRGEGGGAARPLLEGFPGLAAAAARLPVRLSLRSRRSLAEPAPSGSAGASRSRALGRARGLSGHSRPRREAGPGRRGAAGAAANLPLPARRPGVVNREYGGLRQPGAHCLRNAATASPARRGSRPRKPPALAAPRTPVRLPRRQPRRWRLPPAALQRGADPWGGSSPSSVFFPVPISKTPFG